MEEFHSGVARLLGTELRESERELKAEIARIDADLISIDAKMAGALSSIKQPGRVVDRVFQLATSLREMKTANTNFDREMALRAEIDKLSAELSLAKVTVLEDLEQQINDGLKNIVTSVFGHERKSPRIDLRETNYAFEVFEDTGTGTAYWSLIVLDLTIFRATQVPFIAHDSLLFKNIENDSVANLFRVYQAMDKQSFVSIDEIEKYGSETAALLRRQSVINLDTLNVLFVKDWRPRRTDDA